jgi:hypothetical protein
MKHLEKLVMIRNLIDSIIADQPNEEATANLYSSRLHIVRAIKELPVSEVAA